MPISRFPAAGLDIATVQLLVEPTGIFVGVQVSDDILGGADGATKLNAAVCEPLPRVAVTVAL
jgi:hypothetical protein